MKEYKFRIEKQDNNKATVVYLIGKNEVTHDFIEMLNEADGVMLLDECYNKLVGMGKETRESIGEIEQFRTLFNAGEVKLTKQKEE